MSDEEGPFGWVESVVSPARDSVQKMMSAYMRPHLHGLFAGRARFTSSWPVRGIYGTAIGTHLLPRSTFARLGLDPGRFKEVADRMRRSLLPSNLRSLDGVDVDDVLDFTLSHSISLYLVPRPSIAQALLDRRGDDAKVRAVLGTRRAEISADCRQVIEGCNSPKTQPYKDLALQALDAFDADLFAPAQAMAANLLDGFMLALPEDLAAAAKNKGIRDKTTKRFSGETRKDFEARLEELAAWEGYVAATLWATHLHYDKGKTPGSSFTRNATAHGAGKGKQYNRRSAIQALMAVAGVLGYLEGMT